MKYHILHRTLAPLMMASQAPGDDTSGGLPSGVTQEGGTTRVVAERPTEVDPNAPTAGDRPEGLPTGFDSWEAYAKSRIAGDAQEPAKEDVTQATPPAPPTPEQLKEAQDTAVSQTLEGVSEDMRPKVEPFVRAFAANQTLTDAEVASAAEATGLSQAIIRQFMKGAETDALKAQLEGRDNQAAAEAANKPILDLFGGMDGWTKFNAWTETGLTEAQAKAFNKAAQDNPEGALELAKTYHALWAAAGNDTPKDLTGGMENTSQEGDVFKSEADRKEAFADPRYGSDPAYRDKVIAKLARSGDLS